MPANLEHSRTGKPSLMKRGVAALVIVAVAAVAILFVVHIVMAIFWVIVAIVAVGAVLWAANALL